MQSLKLYIKVFKETLWVKNQKTQWASKWWRFVDYGSNSLLKKAVEHYKNDKDELYTFLENGYIDISNNLAERTVKPFVIARKNFMFCKTSDGADVTSKLFSIIQTTRANGLKTELYIKYVIDNIGRKDINTLLPWSENIKKKFMI